MATAVEKRMLYKEHGPRDDGDVVVDDDDSRCRSVVLLGFVVVIRYSLIN